MITLCNILSLPLKIRQVECQFSNIAFVFVFDGVCSCPVQTYHLQRHPTSNNCLYRRYHYLRWCSYHVALSRNNHLGIDCVWWNFASLVYFHDNREIYRIRNKSVTMKKKMLQFIKMCFSAFCCYSKLQDIVLCRGTIVLYCNSIHTEYLYSVSHNPVALINCRMLLSISKDSSLPSIWNTFRCIKATQILCTYSDAYIQNLHIGFEAILILNKYFFSFNLQVWVLIINFPNRRHCILSVTQFLFCTCVLWAPGSILLRYSNERLKSFLVVELFKKILDFRSIIWPEKRPRLCTAYVWMKHLVASVSTQQNDSVLSFGLEASSTRKQQSVLKDF